MNRKSSFPPVIDSNVHTLILGSLPGEVSLAQSQYYGNPKNKFWHLMSEIIAVNLISLEYPQRLHALLAHGIGLWDVIADAHREGSLDSKIRHQVGNDLQGLLESLPLLHTIGFNGGTAARLGLKNLKDQASQYRIVLLPSSSPAFTMSYANKLAAWQSLRSKPDVIAA